MVKEKYNSVLELGKKLEIKDGDVTVENNVLKVKGIAKNQYEKDLLWDEIKKIGGESPSDIMADIKVEDNSVYTRHTVKKGESLSKIAKHYYGKANAYHKIFEANTDILKNPDLIHPGQVLVIPHK